MSKLTDEQIEAIYKQETGALIDDSPWALVDFSRAIEAAATAPLLERIKKLEQRIEAAEKQEPFGYFCDWGDYMGSQRIAMYYGDPGSAIEDDWNEYPKVYKNLKLYAIPPDTASKIAQLEQERDSLRKQMEKQKDEWLTWEAKRKALEKDAESYRQLRNGRNWPAVFASHDAPEPLRGEELDAAMQKGQS